MSQPEPTGQSLAVAAESLYLVNLMLAPGLAFLAIVWLNGRKGLYDEKHFPVEAAAIYWHFIDVVWIVFYPALYLIGTPIL